MRWWRHRPNPASTPSRARGWPRRLRARRWSSTSPTRRRSKTRPCWRSSRPQAATFWPRKRPPASGITSRCRWSAPSACSKAVTFRAKLAQEKLIKGSGIPYTILRATQFFEFVGAIVQSGTDGDTIRLSPALIQPIASDDVAAALADLAVAPPLNGTVEVAGPEPLPIDKLARQFMAAKGDSREVIADVHARYFGAAINDRSLTPGEHPRIGKIRFENWLSH